MPRFAGAKQIKNFVDAWKEKVSLAEVVKHPELCDLCGKAIVSEDEYYVGVDRNRIWAWTCDSPKCHGWLEHKKKFKVPFEEKK